MTQDETLKELLKEVRQLKRNVHNINLRMNAMENGAGNVADGVTDESYLDFEKAEESLEPGTKPIRRVSFEPQQPVSREKKKESEYNFGNFNYEGEGDESNSLRLINTREEKEEPIYYKTPTSIGGILCVIFGVLITMTGILFFIGIPLIIIGIVLLIEKSKQKIPVYRSEYQQMINSEVVSEDSDEEVQMQYAPGVEAVEEGSIFKSEEEPSYAKASMDKESGYVTAGGSKRFVKTQPEKKTSFESNIGLKWFTIIGITALVIGVGFFFKYAFENEWINHLTRIILGCLLGIGLIVSGDIIANKKEKYLLWGRSLVGGGFAILYFVVYAAYYFKDYREAIGMSLAVDITLLIIVATAAVALSLIRNSRVIAAEAFFLGYLTSLLSGEFMTLTLIYSLILTFGIVVVSLIKKWSRIGLGGIVGSYTLYIFWMFDSEPSFAMKSTVLIIYFAVFLFQAIMMALYNKKDTDKSIASLLMNTGFFAMLYWIAAKEFDSDVIKVFLLATSFVFSIVHLMTQGKVEKFFSNLLIYLTIAFFSIDIPILMEVDNPWLSVVLIGEILGLIGAYMLTKEEPYKISAGIVTSVVGAKLFMYDIVEFKGLDIDHFKDSNRFFILLIAFLVFYFIGWLTAKFRKGLFEGVDKYFPDVYTYLGTTSLIVLTLTEYRYFLSSVLGGVSIILLLLFFFKTKEACLKYSAYFVTTAVALKVILYDLTHYEGLDIHNFGDSKRFFILIGFVALFYFISWLIGKKKDELFKEEGGLMPDTYTYLGSGALIILYLTESRYYLSSIIAGIVMVGLIWLSFRFKDRSLRISSYILTGFIILKFLFNDLDKYDGLSFNDFFSSLRVFILFALIATSYFTSYLLKKGYYSLLKDIKEELVGRVSRELHTASIAYSVIGSGFWIVLFLSEAWTPWSTVLAALSIVIYLFLAQKFKSEGLKYSFYVVTAFVILKLIGHDFLKYEGFDIRQVFGSTRFWISILVACVLYFSSYVLAKSKDFLRETERVVADIYAWGASSLVFILVIIEAQHFWISFFWMTFAAILLLAGFFWKYKQLRLQGLIVFGITIFKVFLIDTIDLDTIYRTLSFITLGVILLSISFVYAKYKDKLEDLF